MHSFIGKYLPEGVSTPSGVLYVLPNPSCVKSDKSFYLGEFAVNSTKSDKEPGRIFTDFGLTKLLAESIMGNTFLRGETGHGID